MVFQDLRSTRSLIQVAIVLDRHLTFRALRAMSLTTTVSDKTVENVVNEIDKVSLQRSMDCWTHFPNRPSIVRLLHRNEQSRSEQENFHEECDQESCRTKRHCSLQLLLTECDARWVISVLWRRVLGRLDGHFRRGICSAEGSALLRGERLSRGQASGKICHRNAVHLINFYTSSFARRPWYGETLSTQTSCPSSEFAKASSTLS